MQPLCMCKGLRWDGVKVTVYMVIIGYCLITLNMTTITVTVCVKGAMGIYSATKFHFFPWCVTMFP